MKKPDKPGKKQAGMAFTATLLIILIFLAVGTDYDRARGTCHVEVKTCHGIPLQESCIGLENSRKKFESADECDQLEEIENTCRQVRNSFCETERQWNKTVVEGFSCGFWERKYKELDLKTCEAINQSREQ